MSNERELWNILSWQIDRHIESGNHYKFVDAEGEHEGAFADLLAIGEDSVKLLLADGTTLGLHAKLQRNQEKGA